MLVKLDNVTKSYKDFQLQCSMELEEGRVTGIIGQNGAGKSTTYKAILGLIHTEGTVEVFDKPVNKLTAKDKEMIGVAFSEASFSQLFRIKDIIPVLKSLYHDFDADDFIHQCERFKLPLDKQIKDFSTGMVAKLKVLIAISHNAKLLLLDEPTAGLDVVAREEVLDMLREYMEDNTKSILISSHISSDLESICDDLYMIHDGKIILHEDCNVLLDEYALLKVSKEQYDLLDKQYILKSKEEKYGYSCLTSQKAFYQENYPEISIEKGNIDEIIMMLSSAGAF